MKESHVLGKSGLIIINEMKTIVAISHTSIIEQKEINNLDLFFSFFDTGGLNEVKSFNETPYNSAKQDKI